MHWRPVPLRPPQPGPYLVACRTDPAEPAPRPIGQVAWFDAFANICRATFISLPAGSHAIAMLAHWTGREWEGVPPRQMPVFWAAVEAVPPPPGATYSLPNVADANRKST